MADIFDFSSKESIADLLNPGGATGNPATWTDPVDGTTYTIETGLHSGGASNETTDNVKYQAEHGGPVYIYTIHNRVRSNIDDPDTALDETQQHSALVTYVVDRDDSGNTTVEVHNIQSTFKDAAGHEFTYPAGVTANLQKVTTDAGDVLTVQYTPSLSTPSDHDGDGDNDAFNGRVNYTLDDSGNATPSDAKVWDQTTTSGATDNPASESDTVNITPTSPFAVNAQNFSIVYTSDGTPVIMQVGSNSAGNMTVIEPDGTFGTSIDVPYSSGATTAEDQALQRLFLSNTEQGIQSVTVDGRTFVYGSEGYGRITRAELTLDDSGTPHLSNPVLETSYSDNSIFNAGIDVGAGNNDRMLATPDIGDGKKYMLIGDTTRWQFVEVQPDGSLSPAGNNSSTVSGEIGPRNDLHVMKYEVGGQEYTGWLLQDPDNADDSWEFFHPDTGWVEVVPPSSGENPSHVSDHDFFMINGHPTWIGTSNRSLDLDSTSKPLVNYVADAGTLLMCFAENTMILTQKGEIAVQDLQTGDLVETLDHGLQPIRWIGSRKLMQADLVSDPKLYPIRIKTGALGNMTPSADLLVSPQHRVLVRSKIAHRMFDTDEVLIAAKHLCGVDGIEIAEDVREVTYFHMLFDRHEVVFSNQAQTESLYTGPEALKAVSAEALDEIYVLFPELQDIVDLPPSARALSAGRKGRRMAMRHVKNKTPLVCSGV